MELLVRVDADLNLAGANAVDNGVDPGQEGVANLSLDVDRGVERGRDRIGRGPAGLAADQETDLVDALPRSIQGKECTDLEVARGDVDRRADSAPLADVLECPPVLSGVVHDELLRCCHSIGPSLPASLGFSLMTVSITLTLFGGGPSRTQFTGSFRIRR